MTTASHPDAAMIDTSDLKRTFKTRSGPVEAVAGVDLHVDAGEIFGFLGPNGAGKTTTLRMLATLIEPTAGEATIAGANLRREPGLVRQRIGYVPQGGSTDPAETGRGELVLQGRLYGLSVAAAKARAVEVLAALDLEGAADRGTGTYSGGMRRRLDVGLGIVHHGRIVAEGTSDQLKQKVAGDVVTIGVNGAGASVLTIVEAMPFVREASHDVESGVVRLYVDRGETAVVQLLRSLDAAGYEPTSISLNKPSLDDVFLRQTGRSLREEAA
jgi:ABC-2 type transport system ATP-binding protein